MGATFINVQKKIQTDHEEIFESVILSKLTKVVSKYLLWHFGFDLVITFKSKKIQSNLP